jgi:Fe-S cluster assembly iron-binding protein IscA
MNIYSINLVFTTDRPLSDEELDTLRTQVIVQVEEPVDLDGNDVDYSTNLIGGIK